MIIQNYSSLTTIIEIFRFCQEANFDPSDVVRPGLKGPVFSPHLCFHAPFHLC